jgi:eukaryotic-like serine/threonine-protein kinase
VSVLLDSNSEPGTRAPRRRSDAVLAPGTSFGRRYEIASKIGSGGMGIVYSAIEVATGNEVAIKVLSASAATPQNVRRFRREGQIAASVENRHCCRILSVGVDGGAPYIVMERLEGETLRRRLIETGALSAADAVAIMLQTLDGLSAAHAAGVLHRDVKPGNIFLTSARGAPPSIKLIDFGLAKTLPATKWQPRDSMPSEDMSAITTTDVVPGTPMYLAPEQINGDRDLDERVDVWAAGLTFYEMLLNQRAFSGSTFIALAKSIVLTTLPAVSSLRSDLPPGFDRLLARALAKHRDQRFRSAEAFRQQLLAEWSQFRAAGVARGEKLRSFRTQAKTVPLIDEVEVEEPTEINVDVHFDPDDLG